MPSSGRDGSSMPQPSPSGGAGGGQAQSGPEWTLSRHEVHHGASRTPGVWEADGIDRSQNHQKQTFKTLFFF